MKVFLFYFLFFFFISLSHCEDGLIETINFQGFLQASESDSPINGTFSMYFYIHDPASIPPHDTAVWQEFFEKVNIKDGTFQIRLGVSVPLTKEIFRTDTPRQLSIKVVPYGTETNQSWIGPMDIDGNPYSVSTVAKKGSDYKEGTLKIIPYDGEQEPGAFALLEIMTPGSGLRHNIRIEWIQSQNPKANTGKGLVIEYPKDMIPFVDYSYNDPGNRTPWGVSLQTDFKETQDISVYIQNGKVNLGGSLEIEPLKIADMTYPADFRANSANVTGNIRVNDLVIHGTLKAPKLEYCNPINVNCETSQTDPFADYLIDPYPDADSNKPTKLNALVINKNGTVPGELLIEGPLQTSQTAMIEMSGTDSVVWTESLVSPFRSKANVEYKLSPHKLSVVDSIILRSDTLGAPDPSYPGYQHRTEDTDALKSPMNPYSIFDLVSTAPICQYGQGRCTDSYCMALRTDYCKDDGHASSEKYYEIDPCQGVPNNQLQGYLLHCTKSIDSDHPNLRADANNSASGQKYFVARHTHKLLENATAEMLIDIINAAPEDSQIQSKLLPVDAVNRTIPQTLTGINIFRDVKIGGNIIASQKDGYDAVLGAQTRLVGNPGWLGSFNPNVLDIAFYKVTNDIPSYMNIHAGKGIFETEVLVRENARFGGKTQIDRDLIFDFPGYFYFPAPVYVGDKIIFDPSAIANDRKLEGITTLNMSRLDDSDNSYFTIEPKSEGKFRSLTLAGNFDLAGDLFITGNATLEESIYTKGNLNVGMEVVAKQLSDGDDPSYFIEPGSTSYMKTLIIEESLKIEGNFTAKSDLTLLGGLVIRKNLLAEQNILLQNPGTAVRARVWSDFTNPLYRFDPDSSSRINTLSLTGNGDLNVSLDANLSGNFTHQGFAKIDGIIDSQIKILSQKIEDFNDAGFVLDPDQNTILKDLYLDQSLNSTLSTSFTGSVTVGNFLHGTSTLHVQQNLSAGGRYRMVSSLEIQTQTGALQLRIDPTGFLLARSLSLEKDLLLGNLDLSGDLSVSGGSVDLNADTSVKTLTVHTNPITLYRSTAPFSFETAIHMDKNANLSIMNHFELSGSLSAGSLAFTSEFTDKMVLSDLSSTITTLQIGDNSTQDLISAGISADSMQAKTMILTKMEDLNDLSFFFDPSMNSRFQTLEILHSLSTQNTLTAPRFLDTDNSYLIDPNQQSRVVSLEVLDLTSAVHMQTSSLLIDAQNKAANSLLFDTVSLKIYKDTTAFVYKDSNFLDMDFHIKNTQGIHISDNSSALPSVLITPGDLDVLIHGKNADYLHHHETIGGVQIHNIARKEIGNYLGDFVTETSQDKAIFSSSFLDTKKIAVSIRPRSNPGSSPLLAVMGPNGDIRFDVQNSGIVKALLFKGSAENLYNVTDIADSTISSVKILDDSLNASVFSTRILSNFHVKDSSIFARHLKNNSIASIKIKNQGILNPDITPASISADLISSNQIDSRVLADFSIFSRHIATNTISSALLIPKTLTTLKFEPQAIQSNRISDGSIDFFIASTGSVRTAQIRNLSLIGDLFTQDAIEHSKLSLDAITESKIASQTLTNSDFANDSILATKIIDLSITKENFRSDTLETSAIDLDAIDSSKFVSSSILAIDILTDAILSSLISTHHKIQNRAITTPKILDRQVLGKHLIPAKILLSHVSADSVTAGKITSFSIQNQDIASETLSGEKIKNLDIEAHQIASEAIIASKIASRVFDSSSIAKGTLGSGSFQDASISAEKIADSMIFSSHIKDLSLIDEDFSTNSLSLEKWQTNTITQDKIAQLSITAQKWMTGAITSAKFQDAAITTFSLSSGAISSRHIQDGAITREKIAAMNVKTSHIADMQIDSRIIAPSSVRTINLTTASVISLKISTEILLSIHLDTDSIDSTKIKTAQIHSNLIQDLSLKESKFATNSLISLHIQTNSVSSRVIASFQVLTTHIADLAIANPLISEDQIDSRVILDDSILNENILTHTLIASDLDSLILTDEHFQNAAITSSKIISQSLFETVWKKYSLLGNLLVPQTITSASIQDFTITSSQIANAALSGSLLETLILTDGKLNSQALDASVFALDAISSGNIVNLSLLASDISSQSLLSTHIANFQIESSDFRDHSILTTNLKDFTFENMNLQPSAFTNDKIALRTANSQSFQALASHPGFEDAHSIVLANSSQILIIATQTGTFCFEPEPLIQSLDSFKKIPSHHQSLGKKVWIASDKTLYLSFENGKQIFEVATFSSPILHFHMEDELHGVLTLTDSNYATWDGGLSWRKLRASANQVFTISRDFLTKIWAVASDGTLSYTTDLFSGIQTVSIPFPPDSAFNLFMKDENNGMIFYADKNCITTNRWTGYTCDNLTISAPKNYIETDFGVAIQPDGKRILYTFSPHNKTSVAFAENGIEILDVSFYSKTSWAILYKHQGTNNIFTAKTTDSGSSYDILSLSTHSQRNTLFAKNSNSLYFVRDHLAIFSTDQGKSWASVPLQNPKTSIESIFFADANSGYLSVFENPSHDLWKTANGGTNWSKTSLSSTTTLIVFMKDDQKGWAVEKGGNTIYKTTDGFTTSQSIVYSQTILDASFDGTYLVFGGTDGLIGRSSDPSAIPLTHDLHAPKTIVSLASDSTSGIWLAFSDKEIAYTTSFSQTAQIKLTSTQSPKAICALSSEVVLSLFSNEAHISHDGGVTWDLFLPDRFEKDFDSCLLLSSGSIFLGTKNPSLMVTRLESGIDESRIALASLDGSRFTTGINSAALQISALKNNDFANRSLDASLFRTHSILGSKIALNAVTSGKFLPSAITSEAIADFQISHAKIALENIDGATKISDDVLTGADFSDLGGIDYILIQTNTINSRLFSTHPSFQITDSDFATKAILSEHIQIESLDSSVFATSVFDSNSILDFSLGLSVFSSLTITGGLIKDNEISLARVLPNEINSSHIENSAISTDHLALNQYYTHLFNDSVFEGKHLSSGFDHTHFFSHTISNEKIRDSSLTYRIFPDSVFEESQIQLNSLSGTEFVAHTITASKFAEGSLGTDALSTGSVQDIHVKTGVLLSSKPALLSVSGSFFQTHSLDSTQILSNVFTFDKIKDNTLTYSRFQNSILTDGHFENLEEFNFQTSAFNTKGVRIYFSDASSIYETASLHPGEILKANFQAATLLGARFSDDNSKVVFVDTNSKIAWADSDFSFVRPTNLSWNGAQRPWFVWESTSSAFWFYDPTPQNFVRYDLLTGATTTENCPACPDVAGVKFVFNESRTRWAFLDNSQGVSVSSGGCASSQINDIAINHDGTYLAFAQTADVTDGGILTCPWAGPAQSFDLGDPVSEVYFFKPDLNTVYLFQGADTLYSVLFSNPTAKKTLSRSTAFANALVRQNLAFMHDHILTKHAITSAAVAPASIEKIHISSLSITPSVFSQKVLTNSHFQTQSITAGAIANLSMTSSVLELATLTSGHFLDSTLRGEWFLASSIGSEKLQTRGLKAEDFATGSILDTHLSLQEFAEDKFSDFSIQTTHIADFSVLTTQIADAIVSTTSIANGSVLSTHVQDLSILSSFIETKNILPLHLADSAITSSKIAQQTLSAAHFITNTLVGDNFESAVIKPLDGYIFTIESGNLYRYDFDGNNRTLIEGNGGWSHIHKTAYSNRVSAMKNGILWEIFPDGSLKKIQKLPEDLQAGRNPHTNNNYFLGGNKWKSDHMLPSALREMTSQVVERKLYIFGGFDIAVTDKIHIFDFDSQTWDSTKTIPSGAVFQHTSALLGSKIYLIGGSDGSHRLNRVDVYDPYEDSWSVAASLPQSLSMAAAATLNSRIYVFGGKGDSGNSNKVYEYNPATDQWSEKAPISYGSLILHCAVSVGDFIYTIGGFKAGNTAEVYRFNPKSNSWEARSFLPEAIREASCSVKNAKIHLVGGYTTAATGTHRIYNPQTDQWETPTPALLSPVRYNLGSAVIDNKLYAFGGRDGAGTQSSDFHLYYEGQADGIHRVQNDFQVSTLDQEVSLYSGFDLFVNGSEDHLIYVTNTNRLTLYNGSTPSVLYSTTAQIFYPRFKNLSEIWFATYQAPAYSLLRYLSGAISTHYTTTTATLYNLRPSYSENYIYLSMDPSGNADIYRLNLSDSSLIKIINADAPSFEVLPFSAPEPASISSLADSSLVTAVFSSEIVSASHLKSDAITSSHILAKSLDFSVLENLSIPEDKFKGIISVSKLTLQIINSDRIVNSSLTTDLIADSSIDWERIATATLQADRISGTLSALKLSDFSVSNDKITTFNLTNSLIAMDSVTNDKILSEEIDSRLVADFSLTSSHFANVSIPGSVFAQRTITNGSIANLTLTSSLIADQTLTASVFALSSITDGKISSNALRTVDLKDRGIPGTWFLEGSISGLKIKDRVLTTTHFPANSIANIDFATASITNQKIATATLTSLDFQDGSFLRSVFKTNNLTEGKIVPLSITTQKIAQKSITQMILGNTKISGDSLKNQAITTAKIKNNSFGSEHFNNFLIASHLDNLSLENSQFSDQAGKKLQRSDFKARFVNARNLADHSITSLNLQQGAIVSVASGLKLTNNQILSSHFHTSGLSGTNLDDNTILQSNLPANLTLEKIANQTISEEKISDGTLLSEDLADNAILSVHIPQNLIPGDKITDGSITQSMITSITGDEIASLSSADIEDLTLTSEILFDLTNKQISQISVSNLKDTTLIESNFSTGAVTAGNFDTSLAKITINKFQDSIIPVARMRNNTLSFGKLKTDSGDFHTLFSQTDANSLHTHKYNDQTLLCPTGYWQIGNSANSTAKQNSVCMSDTAMDKTLSSHKADSAALVLSLYGGNVTVRASICSLEQLWKAKRSGFSVDVSEFSRDFQIRPSGFGGTLKSLLLGDPDSSTGPTETDAIANNTYKARYCF